MISVEMDKTMVWRVFRELHGSLKNYRRTRLNDGFNYGLLHDIVKSVSNYNAILNGDESVFLEWCTKSYNNENAYSQNSTDYGLRVGMERPECYSNCEKALDRFMDDREIFDYFYNEYIAIQMAKNSQEIIDERNDRTCDKCETRFDTTAGMHRHKPKCKGLYRGEYHSKPFVKCQTTSVW
jgi:hypothetical protein